MFPSASPLRSTSSAPGDPGLFAGFVAPMEESDFFGSCIIGLGSSPSRCGPVREAGTGQPGDLPVPAQRACAHARVCDHAGPQGHSRWRAAPYGLPPSVRRRRPEEKSFRGSMAGLHVPRPTLRPHPRGWERTAWGQCGSRLLHCSALSPPAPCRSPGAHRFIFFVKPVRGGSVFIVGRLVDSVVNLCAPMLFWAHGSGAR